MSKQERYNVAMVGATGAVGETLLSILEERDFPVGEFVPVASERSAGSQVSFGHKQVTVRDLAQYDFKGIDIAFFSAGGAISREHVPRAADAGAIVIDNTSEFRYQPDVPLVTRMSSNSRPYLRWVSACSAAISSAVPCVGV